MTCESCGDKPKKCNKDFTRTVVEIDNPEQITLMRKVTIPASMGDDTTVPPVVGKYKNVLLYYEANQKSYLYSSDGIPTQLVNGLTDYEAAINLPQINSHTLIGDKTATQLGLQDKLTAGANISIDPDNVISAVDTTYGPATDTEIGLVKPGAGLKVASGGILDAPSLNYSTAEIDAKAKWIDDSAIYKKTIDFGALPNNGTKDVAHNVSGISKIIKLEGYAYDSGTGLFVSLGSNDIILWADSVNVEIRTYSDWSYFSESYITIYYTKSS